MTKQLVVNDEHRFIKMEARTSAQLFKIYGWVKREEMAARKKGDKNGEVAIKNPYTGNLNLIKEMDKPIPIQNGFLVSFHAFTSAKHLCCQICGLSHRTLLYPK